MNEVALLVILIVASALVGLRSGGCRAANPPPSERRGFQPEQPTSKPKVLSSAPPPGPR